MVIRLNLRNEFWRETFCRILKAVVSYFSETAKKVIHFLLYNTKGVDIKYLNSNKEKSAFIEGRAEKQQQKNKLIFSHFIEMLNQTIGNQFFLTQLCIKLFHSLSYLSRILCYFQ